ncbi:FKBP-type peptidyl-prolyl cis-trans isomerase [Hufsiella ginkgonis]|uniref:Peptidyl-prolyl cis-trans isomerase n=1 Tax=Hufsiella ginkgonis TaxID=2695274 RepID=A0A7K1Y3P8_9SPHI|nr:FKBP-type peptidyl-prolyl cis-trans isomerase [Hufsiella ginkgonis]MXV17913.1 FKBP-type peptidylprolyl isomerase [Hufsiella ginkgonis]
MKTKLIILGIAALGLASCQQYKKGEGGLLYKIHRDKDGATLKEGDFMAIKAIQKTEEDSIIYNSYDFDQPTFMPMGKPSFKGDIFTALELLSEGDSATFKVPLDSLVKRGMPKPSNPKNKYMIYTFVVEKVIPKGTLNDSVFNAKIQDYIGKEKEKAKSGEDKKVAAYVADKGLKLETSPSGLKYVVTQKGAGALAAKGDTVTANYTGSFLSGKVFDTSVADVAKKPENKSIYNAMRTYEPIKVPVGLGGSIAGFEEALSSFPKGTKVTVLMPSKLAYGEMGNQGIPPFTPLVFDLEIVNITKGSGIPAQLPPPVAPK